MRIKVVYCAVCGYVPHPITEEDEVEKEVCRFCNSKFVDTEKDWGYFLECVCGVGGNKGTGRQPEEEVRVQFVYDHPVFDREKYEKYHAQWEEEVEAKHEAQRRAVYGSAAAANAPKCPTCGSTNIRSIGAVERGASVFTLGLFSKKINKTFKCNHCGYTW